MILSNNYLYIHQFGVKVKLLAKNDVWECDVDGTKVKIRASVERELVYSLVTGDNLMNFYELLRSCFRKNDDIHIEVLKEKFVESHPQIECGKIEIIDTPSYAESGGIEILVAPKKSIIISPNDEQRLLEIIKNDIYCIRPAIDYFNNICQMYGYNFSKKISGLEQGDLLFRSFLHQHGLSYDIIWQRIWLEQNKQYKHGTLPIELGIIDKPAALSEEEDDNMSIFGVMSFIYTSVFCAIVGCISYNLAYLPMILHLMASGCAGVSRTKRVVVTTLVYGVVSAILFCITSLCIWQTDNIRGVTYFISFFVSILLVLYSWLILQKRC